MKSISVILNEHSKYTIELKDEYKLNEFIDFFEAEIHIVKGYRLDKPVPNPSQTGPHAKGASTNVAELTEDDC